MSKNRKLPACGNKNCGVSSHIGEGPSFGRGDLDFNGFWEIPCGPCARAYEKDYPEEEAWPFREDSKWRVNFGGDK